MRALMFGNLLYDPDVVGGIVKGMKFSDWPASGWQALGRLALNLRLASAPKRCL